MKMFIDDIREISITILVKNDELNMIRKTFDQLKILLNTSKRDLYTKALLWIVKSKKARAEFIKYVQDEKEKILKRIIEQDT